MSLSSKLNLHHSVRVKEKLRGNLAPGLHALTLPHQGHLDRALLADRDGVAEDAVLDDGAGHDGHVVHDDGVGDPHLLIHSAALAQGHPRQRGLVSNVTVIGHLVYWKSSFLSQNLK